MNIDQLTQLLLSKSVVKDFIKAYQEDKKFQQDLNELIPEVELCFQQSQRTVWHLYNVMEHILYSVQYMNQLTKEIPEKRKKMLAYTMFFHDLGKPEYHKTKNINGKEVDSFTFHQLGSKRIAERVLEGLDFSDVEKTIILTLVEEHDAFLKFLDHPLESWQIKLTTSNLEEYIKKLNPKEYAKQVFDDLILVSIADNQAQNPEMTKEVFKKIERIQNMAKEISFSSS